MNSVPVISAAIVLIGAFSGALGAVAAEDPPRHPATLSSPPATESSPVAEPGEVVGVVVHSSGVPQADAEVILYCPGKPPRTTRSDGLGRFRFDGVPTGWGWLAAGDRVEVVDRRSRSVPTVLLVGDPVWGGPVSDVAETLARRLERHARRGEGVTR